MKERSNNFPQMDHVACPDFPLCTVQIAKEVFELNRKQDNSAKSWWVYAIPSIRKLEANRGTFQVSRTV